MSVRVTCYRCLRPTAACCCDLPSVANRLRVALWQHPRERRHPINTVRFLRAGLRNLRVQVAWDRAIPAPPSTRGLGLLFPARHAVPLEAGAPVEELWVLDGTWAQAKSLYRANPWLATLPTYVLPQVPPSRYRIRREPKAHYTSTLEAVALALETLGQAPHTLEPMLRAFEQCIDRQIEYRATPPAGSWTHPPKARRPRRLPGGLLQAPERVLLVQGEVASRAQGGNGGPLYWVAQSLDGTRRFAQVAQLHHQPSAEHWAQMGLERHVLEQGIAPSELAASWAGFVQPSDVVVAWNTEALRWMDQWFGAQPAGALVLRDVYFNYTGQRAGHLEDLATRLSLSPRVSMPGRAGQRAALAAALVQWLRDAAEVLASRHSAARASA